MTDLIQILANIHRPRLLIRAARFGLEDYRRERDLKRLTHSNTLPSPVSAVSQLIAEEERQEDIRKSGDVSYRVSKHVEVLIALMAEARLLPKGPRPV
ncbi:MAG: DUF6477 family protein [Paracoccaceae bacterium]